MQQPSWMAVALSKRIWIRILIFGQKKIIFDFFPPKLEYIFEYFFLKKNEKEKKQFLPLFRKIKKNKRKKFGKK